MVGASVLGRQQQEDQIDVLVVDRPEFDRLIEPGKEADDAGEPGHSAVRNGNATADGGRPETLALQQRLENVPPVHAGQLGCRLGELLQRLFLVLCP